MPATPSAPLADGFPARTRDEWRALVRAVLARSGGGYGGIVADDGTDPEDALTWTTYDGIAVRPLYTAEDASPPAGPPGSQPFVRGSDPVRDDPDALGWDVRTRHADGDPGEVNAAVLEDLERGATSLWLVLGGRGLPVADLSKALEGVYLDLAPVVLDAGADVSAAAAALVAHAEQAGVSAALRGSLGADPIGVRASSGAPADLAGLAGLAEVADSAPDLRLATVDATVFHGAGASDAQELGIATAVGVAYLRALTDAGLSVDAALRAVEFRFAVTAEQFPSIAKLRAARLVWDRVAELSGAGPDRRGQSQHAVTSAAMLTRRDPWVNMLRATIACSAAAVGGAEAITVLPFDAAIGVSDGFARRIARNTSAVLHDESSLGRVADAAGGSWYVESLTDRLAERAWDVFTGIERAGGALAALDSGAVEALLAATRERRSADIATRRAPITGVSEFAFVDEPPVDRPPLPAGADGGGGPLVPQRYAQEFEQLRDRSDAHLAATGARPRVHLVTLEPSREAAARATFAAGLFAAGGIECSTGPADAPQLSGPVVCLCASDSGYAEQAADAVAALRAAGATQVWLAGRVEVPGVDGHVYQGCDALAVLDRVLSALEVAP